MESSIFSANPMIDFHTHTASNFGRTDVLEIISSHVPLGDQLFSLERHPWKVSGTWSDSEKNELSLQLRHSNCLALGEIGLDKLKGVELNEQLALLKSILAVANQETKCVIIHCVKAYDEIIQLKKEFTHIPKWAIHGFNKNGELAKQLIAQGFYLSVNCGKVNELETLLKAIPLDRLFLETDNSAFLIEDNYLRAAKILEMSVPELQSRISQNAKTFFRYE